ncbi:MAG: YcxB family protein [Chloroflexota bacterium]|nr:YcxB family protein [Chloroflexota bacterium]MBI5703735.1 YcxB family protein [Chloroflexota bacterium]
MISFKFLPSKTDYLMSFWAFYFRQWKQWAGLLFLALFFTASGLFASIRRDIETGYLAPLPAFFALVITFILIFALLVNPYRAAQMVERNERLRSMVEGEASEDRIVLKDQFVETKLDWGSFQEVIEIPEYFILIYSSNKNMFHIIPKRAFKSSNDKLAFQKLLYTKIPKVHQSALDLRNNPLAIIILATIIGIVLLNCLVAVMLIVLENFLAM